MPASSYGSNTSDNSATRDTGREDGRFNSDSYSKEGSGSYGVQPSSTSVDEGSLGGRQVCSFVCTIARLTSQGWPFPGILLFYKHKQ